MGVSTQNLPSSATLDELLGNVDMGGGVRSTSRIPFADFMAQVLANAQMVSALSRVRLAVTSPVTMQVGFPGAVDSDASENCVTFGQAWANLCNNYDHRGHVPTIQFYGPTTAGGGGAVTIYTSPILISYGASPKAKLEGTKQVIVDLGGSHLRTTDENAVFLRGAGLWMTLQNGKISVLGTIGHLIETYDGGNHVELNGGLEFGSNPSGYGKLSATRGARISTRPGSVGYSITGGGGAFLQAIVGGRIEFEGVAVTITDGISFDLAFLLADDESSIGLFGVAWLGGTPICKLYKSTKLGMVNTNGHYGGQSITLPAPAGGTYTTKNYGIELGYVPGTIPGESGEQGGRMTDPGLPSIVTGGGTGAAIQAHLDGFVVVLGSSPGTSIEIKLGNRAFWQLFQVQAVDPAALPNCRCTWIGATDSEPAHLYISWDSTGWMATKAISVLPIM